MVSEQVTLADAIERSAIIYFVYPTGIQTIDPLTSQPRSRFPDTLAHGFRILGKVKEVEEAKEYLFFLFFL
jgi:hypothetical protein